jgi:hypothetical protein
MNDIMDTAYAFQLRDGTTDEYIGIYRDFTVDPENEDKLRELIKIWFGPDIKLNSLGMTQDELNSMVIVMYLLKEKYLKE